MTLKDELLDAYFDLERTTKEKEYYEYEYSLVESKKMFSAEVNALGSQPQREAQLKLLMEQEGMYRKLVDVRTNYKIAYYRWATLKSLLENGGDK